jgi:HSP20 family molecular chaperone IbpA
MNNNNQIPTLLTSLLETTNANSSFSEQLSEILSSTNNNTSNLWQPNIDLIETENKIILYMNLGGVKRESIHVDFFSNYLCVKGERELPELGNDENIINRRQELIYGNFERKVALSLGVTMNESVNIEMENGILIIKIDKNLENNNRITLTLS